MLVAKVLVATAAAISGPAPAHLMPRPPGPITISADTANCQYDYATGCADIQTGTIYARRGDKDTLSHELGHFFDARVLTDADRNWFTPRLGFEPGTPWKGCRGCQSPQERFADAYMNCDRGYTMFGHRQVWDAGYGYVPRSERAMHDVCGAIKAQAPSSTLASRTASR